jgi:hypothetical protein
MEGEIRIDAGVDDILVEPALHEAVVHQKSCRIEETRVPGREEL